jgi:alpha-amylase/alpha-mannosidase (GH57 family)
MSARSVVIHGHFYQPPREDPWLEEVPREHNAAPFHDWNERIERECYRAVVAARVPGAEGRIARITNTLESISFDAGPTLLAWMEIAAPATYRAFLDADRVSAERLQGHGNALASPYHHVILPLSSHRDRRTEILWGIADFEQRFGRRPEGFWLPETAVDAATLDALAEAGMAFTILAPHQVASVPPAGAPGRYRAANGRDVALFLYDGPISHDVAFGPLIRNAQAWADRLARPGDARLISVATDGETFGHHHKFGEMALAAVLADLSRRQGITVENYAAVLARDPDAARPVELVEPSSWSCPHGVGRWRSDCGCRVAPERKTSQAWRAPLREGLDRLAAGLHDIFETDGAALLNDPWAARDAYGAVVTGGTTLDRFLEAHGRSPADADRRRAAELLEMERHALGMLTSCGWFFDDIGGLEGRQVLRYAARAIELAGARGAGLEAELRATLSRAASNDPALGTGRDIYDRIARPALPAGPRVAGGYAAARALGAVAEDAVPLAYRVTNGPADDGLEVRHLPTGVTERMTVTVERPGAGSVRVLVEAAPRRRWELAIRDLPERAVSLVTPELEREVADLWFTEAETEQVCRGTPVGTVAGAALMRAVLALDADASPIALAQVADLTDLLALLEAPVPFDVQTAFHALRRRLPADRAARLAPVARRLGFDG